MGDDDLRYRDGDNLFHLVISCWRSAESQFDQMQKVGARRWIGPIMIVWGVVFLGIDVREHAGVVLRAALPARDGGIGLFPGRGALSHLLVSAHLSGEDHLDVHERHRAGRERSGSPFSGWIMAKMGHAGGPGQLAVAVFAGGNSVGDRGNRGPFLSQRRTGQRAVAPAGGTPAFLLAFARRGRRHSSAVTGTESRHSMSGRLHQSQAVAVLSGLFRCRRGQLLCRLLDAGDHQAWDYERSLADRAGLDHPVGIRRLRHDLVRASLRYDRGAITPTGTWPSSLERCWPSAFLVISRRDCAAVHPPWSHIAVLAMAVAGIMASISTFWALPASILTGAAAAAGLAWINSVGNLGGFVGPYAIGWIHDHSSNPLYPALLVAACWF